MSSKRNTRSNTPSSINSNTKGTDNSLNNDDNQQDDKMMHSQAFLDAIEDVHTRFILNLPQEELATSNRLFFQIEQAWWFYEDLICDELEDDAMNQQSNNISPLQQQQYSQLPRFKKMYTFARKMFEISSLLSPFLSDFDQMWQEFSKYKRKISTYGTILLNTDCTKVVLCQEYHGKAWTFPAGKVNQNERGRDAAARETYEETGFDPTCNIGETKHIKERAERNGVTISWSCDLREEDALVHVEEDGKRRTCYVVWGVPESFPFRPVARKEVSDIAWHNLNNLPKKSFAVLPFLKQLRKWIRNNIVKSGGQASRKSTERGGGRKNRNNSKNGGNSAKKDRVRSRQNASRSSQTRSISSSDHDLVKSGLCRVGDTARWSEEEMFRTNEELIGRKIEYDGNPQVFANKGFDGIDPHAFRIVGGEFMNSGGNSIAKAPHQSQLQPLFRPESFSDSCVSGDNLENEEDDDLKPFFSDNGATPWGEYVSESVSKSSTTAKKSSKHKNKKQNIGQQDHQLQRYRSDSSISAISDTSKGSGDINFPSPTTDACDDDPINTNTTSHGNAAGLAILKMLRGNPKYDEASKSPEVQTIQAVSPPPPDMDQFFLTDREITARSQNQKLGKVVNAQLLTGSLDNEKKDNSTTRVSGFLQGDDEAIHRQENHYQYMRNWVDSLPKSEPSKIFGDFHFDVEAIMSSMGATTMT